MAPQIFFACYALFFLAITVLGTRHIIARMPQWDETKLEYLRSTRESQYSVSAPPAIWGLLCLAGAAVDATRGNWASVGWLTLAGSVFGLVVILDHHSRAQVLAALGDRGQSAAPERKMRYARLYPVTSGLAIGSAVFLTAYSPKPNPIWVMPIALVLFVVGIAATFATARQPGDSGRGSTRSA